jgi:hypothetical protein
MPVAEYIGIADGDETRDPAGGAPLLVRRISPA